MEVPIYQVDAFANEAFAGNPAAVCILEEAHHDDWMQHVAREMNLSETAFLYKQENGYGLRWFTPTTEVDLCGHATLASAHILWETSLLGPNEVAEFNTLSGPLKARRNADEIELEFPATRVEPVTEPTELGEALGIAPIFIGKSMSFYLLEAKSESTVRELRPDFKELKTRSPDRAVIVTSIADTDEYDIVSRCFAPNVGIDEDPVTGSAHCCLGPYWSERFGRNELTAYQASERGGAVRVRVDGDRVFLSGRAVTVLRGVLVSP
jgi:PhzF family phenazine biosynthesis protein